MVESKLMGFVRKTKNGNAITISIDTEALRNANTYTTRTGKKYISMIINLAKLEQLLKNEINFTTINQIVN